MKAVRPRADRPGFAVLIALAAFGCFTGIDSSAKWLGAAGLPALQVAFVRYAGHFVAVLAAFLPSEGPGVFRSNAPWLQVGRALTLLTGTALNFVAVRYLPLTVTTAIFFASPMLVCLLSIPMLGERVGLRRFAAIGVGFLGVLVITRPWGASFHWAMLCSLGALTAASTYFVLTRMIAGRDDNPTGQVITAGLPTLVLAPVALSVWVWPERPVDFVLMGVIGLFGAFGHSFLTVAHRYAAASTLAPVVYAQIVYVSLVSWAVFAQPPDAQTVVGTAIIVAAGLYIWRRERAEVRAAAFAGRRAL